MNNEPDRQPSARRVEAYLETMLTTLPHSLSASERDGLRREVQEHLWSRIEAYEELGQSKEDAVTEALSQFGGGKDFVKQWRREWRKPKMRVTRREVWEAGKAAVRPSLVGISSALLPFFAFRACYLGFPGSTISVFLNSQSHWSGWGWVWLTFLLLPAFAGMRHGWHAPERAGVGMLAALTAEFLAVTLLYQTACWALPSQAWASSFGSYVRMDGDLLINAMALWIPIMGGAAAVSGWLTRRAGARQMA